MPTSPPSSPSPRWLLILAFLAVYVFWGSTYLGIKVVVRTLPPLALSGIRFTLAGALLYGLLRARGLARPTRPHWKTAFITGACLILGGNGLVSIAVIWIDSGLASVLVATTPIYMTLLGWWTGQGKRPGPITWAALALGIAGIVVLLDPASGGGNGLLFGAFLAILAPLFWSAGALYGKRSPQPASALLFAAMQMFAGGVVTFAASVLSGEAMRADWSGGTASSWWALAYLLVFGSWVGFSAFVYITKHTAPAASSSYAYVNPVIAVLLGNVLLGERIGARDLAGMAMTLAAVAMILWANTRKIRT